MHVDQVHFQNGRCLRLGDIRSHHDSSRFMHSGLANTLRTSFVKLSGWKIPSHKVLMKLSVDQRIIKSIQDDLKDPWVEIRMDLQDLFGKAHLFWPFFPFHIKATEKCVLFGYGGRRTAAIGAFTLMLPLKFSGINWLIRAQASNSREKGHRRFSCFISLCTSFTS